MGLVDQIIGVESGGNPNATNPRSSATGAGQFLASTWIDTLAKHRPDLAGSMGKDELLALRNDPQLSRAMTEAYAADNGAILSGAGLPVTPTNTYLAHFAGPQGAVKVLSADPSTSVESILGLKVVEANPFLRGMKAADLQAWAARKMGGAQSAPQVSPQPRPVVSQQVAAVQPPIQVPQAPPIFASAPRSAAPPQAAPMAAPEQMQAPPIFAPPRKPIDLSRLKAALEARQSGGFFNGRGTV
jgi:hypothetical protein